MHVAVASSVDDRRRRIGGDAPRAVTGRDDVIVIAVAGEIDLHTAPLLQAELDRAVSDGTRVVVDLTDTTFLDSSGLAVLLAAQRRLEDHAGGLVLRAPSSTILRTLAWTGLEDVLAVDRRPQNWDDRARATR